MAISIDTIRSLKTSKTYYLANSTGEITEASKWQRFKCWLGVGDGRAKVARLAEAVKTTLLESAGLKAEAELNTEIGALNMNKSLSGGALAEIATRFAATNAGKIASVDAGKIADHAIADFARKIVQDGKCVASDESSIRDLLRRAVGDLCDSPARVVKNGREVLDSNAFKWKLNRVLTRVEAAVGEIVTCEALGCPKMDRHYAAYVKTALWNENGSSTGLGVANLRPAADVHFEAAREKAKEQNVYARKDAGLCDAAIRTAIAACTDPDALEIVIECVGNIVKGGDDKLRTTEKIREKVTAICDNVAELRQITADHPATFWYGRQFLVLMEGKTFPHGMLGRVVQSARTLPIGDALRSLSAGSSGTDVFHAVEQFKEAILHVMRESDAGKMIHGVDAASVFNEFVIEILLDRIDAAEVRGIYEGLQSEEASKLSAMLQSVYAGDEVLDDNHSEALQSAIMDVTQEIDTQLSSLNRIVARRLGKPDAGLKPFNGVVERAEFDANGVSGEIAELGRQLVARYKATYVNGKITGDGPAANSLRQLLSDKLGPEPYKPADAMRDKLKRIAGNLLNRGLARDLRNVATGHASLFAADFSRISEIKLGNAVVVDKKNLDAARNQFARFVLKNPDAAYAELDLASKRKVDAVMALASQNTQNAIAFGVGVLLHPEGTHTNFTATGGEMTRKVAFAFDDDGALVVKFVNDHKPAIAFIGANDAPIPCGPGSKLKQSIEITVSAAELDRLASLDFAQYDDAPYMQRVDKEKAPDAIENARELIPQDFRLNAQINVDWEAEMN